MQGPFRVFSHGAIVLVTALAACTQPEPAPEPITPQPIYNKYGDVVGCEGGVYTPGANLENPCLPPDDGCDPQSSTTAAGVPCYPRGEGGEPDGQPTGQTPGATTGV